MLRRRFKDAESIPWGPFQLGRAGVPVTIFSLVYTAQGFFFSFWPSTRTISQPADMNWIVVVFAGVIVGSLIFWGAHGRKTYKGPIVEVQVG